jgi:hypothetical protein
MSFQIPSSVKTLNPVLLHEWAGPFTGANLIAAAAAANAYIPGGVRVQGLEVILIAFGYAHKYWYQMGTTDADLIPMGTDPLEIQDEGLTVEGNTKFINFTGAGVTATSVASGFVEVNIPGGGGTSSCGDILKIAAVSGMFSSASETIPNLSNMVVGNTDYGWSYGKYNAQAKCDGYGNMQSIETNFINCLIPLPADFLPGDVIKICGVAISSAGVTTDEFPHDYNFYLSVSTITCQGFDIPNYQREVILSTLISPQTFPFTLGDGTTTTRVCFSVSTTVTSQLPGCTTYLLVGLNAGSETWDGTYNGQIKFSYTLDGVKHCSTGTNLFIRNCCEPLYSEIIANNSTPVGESFSDADGNCWTVVAETHDNITGTRTKANAYNDCTACTVANPCPLNYLVESCCTPGTQTFSASISSSLAIGDGFVDNNGFCWTVVGTTSTPSTYIISVVTVYPVGGDPCTECITSNPCPEYIVLDSCCGLGPGYTTEALLTAGGYTPASYPTTIIDQFGFCWYADFVGIINKPLPGGFYPNLGFIQAVSESVDCAQCIADNTCPASLFYTLKNCCTEEIFVAELSASYYMEMQLTIIAAESVGCFTVQGWSTTGPATLTSVIVIGTDFPGIGEEAVIQCQRCYSQNYTFGCYGEVGCFYTVTNYAIDNTTLTYIGCDGVYHYNETFAPGATVCVMWWDQTYTGQPADWYNSGEACLQVFNPSSTESITVSSGNYGSCGGPDLNTVLAPGDATPCGSCFNLVDSSLTTVRWEVVTPNTC